MSDINLKPGEQLPDTAEQKYILMPDGTYALQVGSTPSLPVTVSASWRVATINEETANDTDKSFQVPADTERQVMWLFITLVTDATVGNRQLEIRVEDESSNVKAVWALAGVVQPASLTRQYMFAPAVTDLAAYRDTNTLFTPIPGLPFLKAGDTLRVFDNKAIAALDDMTVRIQHADRSIG